MGGGVTLYGPDGVMLSQTDILRLIAALQESLTSANSSVAAEAVTRAAADTAEAATRASADATLTANVATNTASIATNAAAITAETTARTSGDSTNASAIAAETTRATAAEALKAPLVSPALTGTPTVPTAAPGTNTTQVASTAFVAALGATKAPALTPTAVKTANYTAAAGDFVPVDTTAGNVTITLPTAPADGSRVGIKHVIQGGTNTVTFACGGSDVFNKSGGATSGTLTLLAQAVNLQYKASGAIWYIVADDLPLSQLDGRYATSVNVLGAYVDSFGADRTGAADSTAAFIAARDSLPTVTVTRIDNSATATYHVGTIRLGIGKYKIGSTSDIGNLGPFVSVVGPGANACVIDYRGSGSCFRAFNAVKPDDDTFDDQLAISPPYATAGTFDGFLLDGTNSGAGAIGLRVGDCDAGKVGDDLTIQHFNKAGSVGLSFDNTVSWTENWTGNVRLFDNTTSLLFTTNGGDGSHGYCDLRAKIYCWPNQTAVAITNGAGLYHGSLTIRGNFGVNTGGNTGIGLKLGSASGAGTIVSCKLNFQFETNSMHGGGGGTTPQTINFFSTASYILSSRGFLSFSGAAWTQSNFTYSAGVSYLGFDGYIEGDDSLNPRRWDSPPAPLNIAAVPTSTHTRTVPQGKSAISGGVLTLDLATGDVFNAGQVTGSAITVAFTKGLFSCPRRISVRVQQNGSQCVLTWPTNGSPTPTNPTVIWEGGIPPVLTRITNAWDWFDLWTHDGATWVGRQRPNVVAAVSPNPINQGFTISASTTSRQITPNANTTVGNTVLVFVATHTPGVGATPTVTDTVGNTYTLDQTVGTTGAVVWVYRTKITTQLTTSGRITVAMSATTSMMAMAVEVPNLGATPSVDQSLAVDQGTTSNASITVGPLNPTLNPGEIAFFFAAAANSGASNPTWGLSGPNLAPQGPWTYIVLGSGSATSGILAWMAQPSPGGRPYGTWTPSVSEAMTSLMLTYRA